MAIISFWNDGRKSIGQTLSVVAVATHMAIEHNYKILIIDANFRDDTIERCFWNLKPVQTDFNKKLNGGKMDISSGAEGLISAVSSNKTTPEIIPNYTRVVLKNRLDILCGLRTQSKDDFEKTLLKYKELVSIANKYYDFVFVDLPKTTALKATLDILDISTMIIYTFPQNLLAIDNYMEKVKDKTFFSKGNVIPLLVNADSKSKYNVKNTSRYIGAKEEIGSVLHNASFMEGACEASVANFFLKTRLATNTQDRNTEFVNTLGVIIKKIFNEIERQKYQSAN